MNPLRQKNLKEKPFLAKIFIETNNIVAIFFLNKSKEVLLASQMNFILRKNSCHRYENCSHVKFQHTYAN